MKKILAFCFAIVMLFSCTGCGLLFAAQDAFKNFEQDQNTVYVAFSKDGEENEPMNYDEIAEYRSVYSKYNPRVMYNTLRQQEQAIYRLLEYALDHEYTSIFIDARLLEGVALSLEELLLVFSMDSPLVQQNYSYSSQESGYTFSYLQDIFTFDIEGSVFNIDNFSHAAMEKKKEALAAAEQVFAAMPEDLAPLEQARYFFRYLTREVKYSLTETKPGEQDNLYDAFVLKQTQCDGFANAFSLLCAMAQIPCVEKVITPEKEGEIGHTWNAFCIDGVWYNADLALSENYAAAHKETDVDFSFGLSDERKGESSDLAERFPPCTTDLLTVDVTVSSSEDLNLLSELKSAFANTENNYVLLKLEEGELSQNDLQNIANYLRSGIRTYTETWGGKNHYFIFKRG